MWWNCYWWGNHFGGLGLTGWWIQWIFGGLIVLGLFFLLSRVRNQPPVDYQKNQDAMGILKKR